MKNFGKTTDIRDIITVGYEADNAVLYSTSQSLTNDQKIQARANIGAGTSNFDGDYKSLANKPTIPKKTSQLENDSNFATTSQVEAKYAKPPEGIPKTDLATAVQNSLTAADNAVKYTSQSLTDAQKEQARKNIGAGTSNFSGNYKDLADKPDIPPEVSIVQSTGESTSSVMSQKATTDAVNGRLSKTDNTNIEVLGTKKATTTLGGNQLYAPNGIIFGGTAAAAGLVTSGICGISTPSAGGACSKENLYINYDGNNDFNASRQVVLNAGTVGNHLGSNMYQYTVPRGDIVKNWVEAKGYATVSGLATVATSGSYNDLSNIPVINQDLTASGFTPVANTYYKHTGTTTDLYTNGVIYCYNGTKYTSLGGSGEGSTTVQGEAIVLANADWEMSGGYNIVPKKPLVDGYEGMLCFNLEVTPNPLDISWDNATAWGDIQNAVGVRLFSFTYEGETQDICFVEFPAGTEINNTVLTFSAYAIWLGTIIPLWGDTEFWKAYGDGGSGGVISANDIGWAKNDGLPVYGNYMRYIVAVSITNIANQDIWGSYITGEQLWTKKPASEFSWSEIYPYYYSATKTLSSTPVVGSEVALLCDSVAEADIRLCASCGVTIGKVDGTNITFYAMDKPYKNLSLFVEYSKQE